MPGELQVIETYLVAVLDAILGADIELPGSDTAPECDCGE
jgi:hypothetical protein